MTPKAFLQKLARTGLKALPSVPPYADVELPDSVDLDNLVHVWGVVPSAGAGSLSDGTTGPRVFLRLVGQDASEAATDTTYSFDPYELAVVTNVINTICASILKDPSHLQTLAEVPRSQGYL